MKKAKFYLVSLIFILISVVSQAQLQPGDKAPNFNLKNIDRQWVALEDYNNEKGVIVIFTCNHCPYAVLYEDRIIDLQSKFGSKGFPVVAINPNDSTIVPDDSFSKMILRAEEKQFNFPYILDDQELFKEYGATRTPHVYLLKNEGEHFSVAYIGAIDDNAQDVNDVEEKYLANAINALLKGEQISVKETRAVGCTIKFHE
ncbi:thioredoxin family protein [Marinilabiliaceae bacterium ANBcel2]|nr:thioredoxin family protein [Marinilabiliaceae bacterium ANBcel2]